MTAIIEKRVQGFKEIIRAHDGSNVADHDLARAIDELIGLFYDDIGEISNVDLRSLLDLFLIKVLYIGRHSTDADVMDYLGEMLTRHLYAKEIFSDTEEGRPAAPLYFSELLEEVKSSTRFQNLFELYRRFADNSLFLTGVFPLSFPPGRRGGHRLPRPIPRIDISYYVSTGKTCYRLASEHDLAEFTHQRETLEKLSDYFELYKEALNEISERYILGFDMNLIADKMLDNFNIYRRTGEEKYLNNARKYAALLKVNESSFPGLFQRRPLIL